ncbi:MAG: hypothetical protein ACI3W7_00170 [Oscillospiraceae bacterium]
MENVLVVKTASLGDIVAENGLITGREQEVLELIASEGLFLARPTAEESPEYKQIIPYVAIVRGGEVFATRRLNKGGEARLHGLMSLGVGGHINEIDEAGGDWLMNCLRREIEEEVDIEDFGTLTLRGLINDNANDVGSVHLGFFFTLTTTGSVSVRETEKLKGGFTPLASLSEEAEGMETWSQIITPELIRLWTAGKL